MFTATYFSDGHTRSSRGSLAHGPSTPASSYSPSSQHALCSFLVLVGSADVLRPSQSHFQEEVGGIRGRVGSLCEPALQGHICHSWAPGWPDTLPSHSDRCIQINQFTAGKGSLGSKSSETRSGLEGQRKAISERARRDRPWARQGDSARKGIPEATLLGDHPCLSTGAPPASALSSGFGTLDSNAFCAH